MSDVYIQLVGIYIYFIYIIKYTFNVKWFWRPCYIRYHYYDCYAAIIYINIKYMRSSIGTYKIDFIQQETSRYLYEICSVSFLRFVHGVPRSQMAENCTQLRIKKNTNNNNNGRNNCRSGREYREWCWLRFASIIMPMIVSFAILSLVVVYVQRMRIDGWMTWP